MIVCDDKADTAGVVAQNKEVMAGNIMYVNVE